MNPLFTSDNTSGVHKEIMQAMVDVNHGACKPYGNDEYCEQAEEEFRKIFGEDIKIFFTLNGTGANVLAIKSLLRLWEGTICSDVAHLHTDECGAPEANTGTKLLLYPAENGKLTTKAIEHYLHDMDNVHHSRPALISITQATEQGTIYSIDEIKAITELAHKHGIIVHMDGARISNAVAALDVDVVEMTKNAGVDVLSFGGTKNGLMMGEALIYFDTKLVQNFFRLRKQSFQHISKMRFIAAQFLAYFKDDLWIKNAKHANAMAQYFAQELDKIPTVKVSRKTEANAVFAIMPPQLIEKLQEVYYFYEFNPRIHEIRLMSSFATTKEDIDIFIEKAKELQKELSGN